MGEPAAPAAGLGETARQAVPDTVVAALRGASAAWILPHERPDGDALGAALGLAAILEQRGARAVVVSADEPASLYEVIPDIDRVLTTPPDWNPDLVVLVDCGDLGRTGSGADRYAALPAETPLLIVDHHVSNAGRPGGHARAWVDPNAAATCEMVALIGVVLGSRFDGPDALATKLATGIVMDTATFQHGNTTPRTLEVAAHLLAAGARISEISRRLYRSHPIVQTRLHARVLARLETSDGGGTVYAQMDDGDLQATGALPEHSEGIVDALAQVAEADVALFFKSDGAGSTRLSVRTKADALDATAIVSAHGGGGHARAAGATIGLPLTEAVPAVLQRVSALRRDRPPR